MHRSSSLSGVRSAAPVSFSTRDHQHMARALMLAERGLFTTRPNPRVGCVLINDGQVVGEGWHQVAGGPHAEIHALNAAGDRARGATAYVTLEPCHHHGRTPPCRQALIEAGVSRVVAAMEDPFPAVAGRGLAALRAAGVVTEVGLMAAQARELNAGFVSRLERGRPLVRLKLAASLDGRTALANGQSKWITSDAARADVQRWRARACAILTGSGTVLADDPRLTARVAGLSQQPLRVVLDSRFRVRPEARALTGPGQTVVIGSHAKPDNTAEVRYLTLGEGDRIDLRKLMNWLAEQQINELHVEAGQTLSGSLLAAGLVDELLLYLAPSVLGCDARGLFAVPPLESMAGRINLAWTDVRRIGPDLRLRLRPT